MTVSKLAGMLKHANEWYRNGADRLERLAAMVGWGGFTANCCIESDHAEVPTEIVSQILRLDYAERATGDLRAMGEAMGKISVQIPSNINVWQHLKAESTLAEAARGLADAAQAIASKS